MKKIFTILSIALLSITFTGCEKEVEEVEEIQDTSHATITIFRCTSCKSNNIEVYYPPPYLSHLPPSYNCNDCGEGGNLYQYKR